MIIDLINNSTFDPKNPFDTTVNIFPKIHGNLSDKLLYDLFFQHWKWVWEGELRTALVYKKILENIKLGKYNRYLDILSAKDLAEFCDYFAIAVQEEFDHNKEIELFLEKIYGSEIVQTLSNNDNIFRIKSEIEEELVDADLVTILLHYFIGECYHWCVFYSFYGQTTEPNKKEILHKFMIEEAGHHNNIYQLLRKIITNIKADHDDTLRSIRKRRYFAYDWVENTYSISAAELLPRDLAGMKLFFDSPWQHDFNHNVLKKIYRVYDLLWPGKTLEEFKDLVNYVTVT